ncbi:response regulator [Aquimarina sp. AU119]|uniref:hybrid sensor histidine kinase/response regulator transcription factor n=1 Tax=Aquimarina sp. AU119 TaxID=2108528 RepID=UPI00135C89F7|nr:response regulator [Aquimarina sp. AU119]
MRFFFIFFLLLFHYTHIAAQNHKIDSLKEQLYIVNNPDSQGTIQNQLSTEHIRIRELDTAESYAHQALSVGIKISNPIIISESYLNFGNINYIKWKAPEAIAYYQKVDSVLFKNNIINITLLKSKYNIGNLLYREVQDSLDLTKIKKYFTEVLDIAIQLKDTIQQSNTHIRLGDLHVSKNEYDKALTYYNKAELLTKNNDSTSLAKLYWALANVYAKKNDKVNSRNYIYKRYNLVKDKKETNAKAHANWVHGHLLFMIEDYKQAIHHHELSIKLYESLKYKDFGRLAGASDVIYKSYEKTGDYKKAFDFLKKAMIYNDSAVSINKRNKVEELETKYQTEKKEQEIALLKSQKELAEQQKKSQRNLYMGGMGITTLVGIFLFVLYRNRQKTNKKLKKLDKAKSHFFSNISHELRTPLTLISGPIQNKLDDKNLTDKDRSDFELVLNNSNRISELVNQLLDISKIEAGSMTLSLQKVHPMQQINAIIKDFEYATGLKNINFLTYINNHEEEGWLDRDAVHKIVTNLVSNAIKYTPENGSIIFNAHIKKHKLFIDIKNTGDGLTKEQRQLVFKRFYQTHSEQSGSGVGLALVNELIKLHEGNITVDSRLNEWTSFNLSISLDKKSIKNAKVIEDNTNIDNTSPYQNHYEVTNTSSNKTDTDHTNEELPIALIVEDNKDLNHLLQENFKNHYKVISAQDGLEGYELALQYIPDIIISDIMMPKKDGIELTNELKNDERTSHIPIILLTAKAGEENELSGLQIGADEYITKPFNQKILTTKASNLITIRKKLQLRYSQEVILTPKDIAITPIDENFLNKVQKVLDKQLIESSFSVEEFSKAIGMSRMQLHRKLKALTGLTSSEFVRSQRLKLAAQLLQSSDTNISQVGYAVGFNDHSYFTKCFKEMYACTPTEYAIKDS